MFSGVCIFCCGLLRLIDSFPCRLFFGRLVVAVWCADAVVQHDGRLLRTPDSENVKKAKREGKLWTAQKIYRVSSALLGELGVRAGTELSNNDFECHRRVQLYFIKHSFTEVSEDGNGLQVQLVTGRQDTFVLRWYA